MTSSTRFENVSIAKRANIYFDGKCVSHTVVLADGSDASRGDEIKTGIIADCRAHLAPHKVPAMIKFVEKLDITAAGKLARSDA